MVRKDHEGGLLSDDWGISIREFAVLVGVTA